MVVCLRPAACLPDPDDERTQPSLIDDNPPVKKFNATLNSLIDINTLPAYFIFRQ